jgi:hypothetical protein
MIKRSIEALCVALVGLGATACGNGDGDGSPLPTITCEPLRRSCDIREAECREAIFVATACERGQRVAEIPPVRIITREQLRDELEAEVSASEPTREDRAWERANKLLRFVPMGTSTDEASVEIFVDGIAAYYSSATKDVTVIEDSVEDDDSGTFTLSHEFVHALQDQRDGFRKVYEAHLDSLDSLVALDSLFEGEATLLSNVVMLFGDDPEQIDWNRYFGDMLGDILVDVELSTTPLMSAIEILPYPVGGRGLAPVFLDGGTEGLEALYEAPYTTLAQWIDSDGRQHELDCDVPAAPENYSVVFGERLGLAGLLAMEIVLGDGTAALDERPSRWTSDALRVYATEGDDPTGVAFAWRLRLRTESAAVELAAQLEDALPDAHVDVQGSEILIASAEDQTVLTRWDALGECDAPKRIEHHPEAQSLSASFLRKRLGLVF